MSQILTLPAVLSTPKLDTDGTSHFLISKAVGISQMNDVISQTRKIILNGQLVRRAVGTPVFVALFIAISIRHHRKIC